MTESNEGEAPAAVLPAPPRLAVAVGEKRSASQPVGVKADVAVAVVPSTAMPSTSIIIPGIASELTPTAVDAGRWGR